VIPAAVEIIRRLGPGLEFHPLNAGAERYLLSTREAAAAIAQRLG
jgi:hypothetical protein